MLLASGAADALSGRWVDVADDLAAVAARSDAVLEGDLYQLRRRKLG